MMNITNKKRRPGAEGWAQADLEIILRALKKQLEFEEDYLPEKLARCHRPGQREPWVRSWANLRMVIRKIQQLQADLEERHGLKETPPHFFFLEGARELVPDGMLDDDQDDNE